MIGACIQYKAVENMIDLTSSRAELFAVAGQSGPMDKGSTVTQQRLSRDRHIGAERQDIVLFDTA